MTIKVITEKVYVFEILKLNILRLFVVNVYF